MSRETLAAVPLWSIIVPFAAGAVLARRGAVRPADHCWSLPRSALIAAVVVAVHHAEVIAHRVGEPFGTLCLRSRSR